MNPIVYDVSMLIGAGLLGAGAVMTWGWGVGLMVIGGSVVALTVTAVLLAMRRA